MRWARLITPMCQILNVVITSCISFVLVYFLLPHELFSLLFFLSGHDRLRPNEMNLCSKPRTTCCTPRRNRFETVRQNIFIFLRGRSFSEFLNSSALPYFKPVNASEWKKKIKTRSGAQLFYRKGGSLNGSWAVVLDIWTSWRFGTSVLSLGNYLSGIQ